jgi:hypothetical protein
MANLRSEVKCYQPIHMGLVGQYHRDGRRIKVNWIVRSCPVQVSPVKGDLSSEEDKTLENEEISSRASDDNPSTITMPEVLLSRLAAIGSSGFVLAMLVGYFFLIQSQNQVKEQPEPMGGNANESMY